MGFPHARASGRCNLYPRWVDCALTVCCDCAVTMLCLCCACAGGLPVHACSRATASSSPKGGGTRSTRHRAPLRSTSGSPALRAVTWRTPAPAPAPASTPTPTPALASDPAAAAAPSRGRGPIGFHESTHVIPWRRHTPRPCVRPARTLICTVYAYIFLFLWGGKSEVGV